MGKFDGVLLAVDFDDTLRPMTMTTVPEANTRAIDYFISEGGLFTVATGRDLRSFQSIKHLFNINAPAVVSNGAAMYDKAKNEIVYEEQLHKECIADIADIMAHFPEVGIEIHRGYNIYVPVCNDGVREHIARFGAEPNIMELEKIPQPWTKFGTFSNTITVEDERTNEICTYIKNKWADRYEPVVSSGIVDVAPARITKASGIAHLCEMYSVSRENLYCAGDSWNDLTMLNLAKLGFTPKGSSLDCAGANAKVVCAAYKGAVAEIVSILDERYS